RRGMTPAQRGDVGRLGALKQIAGSEETGVRGSERRVYLRPARPRVELEAGDDRQLVVWDPVGGEHDGVTGDRPGLPCLEITQLDLLDARNPTDLGQRSSRPKRHAV